jgi:serine acetyltransferase
MLNKIRFLKFIIKEIADALEYQYGLFKLLKNSNVRLEKGVEIRGFDSLQIGKDVIIGSQSLINCGGFEWSEYKGMISIGDHSYIGPHSVLLGAGEIEIGKDVLIGPGVFIASHGHMFNETAVSMREQPTKFAKISIEDDVWIGSNAVILPGIKIGRGSIVGAGAVVSKNIPSYSIAVGIPARVIKDRKALKNSMVGSKS